MSDDVTRKPELSDVESAFLKRDDVTGPIVREVTSSESTLYNLILNVSYALNITSLQWLQPVNYRQKYVQIIKQHDCTNR